MVPSGINIQGLTKDGYPKTVSLPHHVDIENNDSFYEVAQVSLRAEPTKVLENLRVT